MAITIYTDGSSRGNPGPGGWGAVIVTADRVVELGGGEDYTTNNRMELSAAINALVHVDENDKEDKVTVYTDSKYVISGITSWVKGWQKNGWKTAGKKDVENKDLWEALNFAVSGLTVDWNYVKGHAGHPGNERCDEIATLSADKKDAHLYEGPKNKYTIDLDAKPVSGVSGAGTSLKKKSSSGVKAYSYLSLIDGIFETHKTWSECEARVKGVRGAKFKKSTSALNEKEIMNEWGVK